MSENTATAPVTLTRLRITFGKTSNLRYVGNLDMHTVWERTFRRAGLPLAYSKGFNPRPKFQIASSLMMGASSRCELLDVWMQNPPAGDQVRAALERAVPPGLEIVSIEEVDLSLPALQTQIVSADYHVTLRDPLPVEELARRVDALREADSLPREWRGKPYDLRPLVLDIHTLPEEGAVLMRLTTREGATGRPEEVLAAMGIDPLEGVVERTAISF